MTTAASSLVRRATDLILDNTSIRWPAHELVRWLNDGQREVVIVRPDATNTTATATMAAGTRQNLDLMALTPAPCKLIEITRNMAATSAKTAVRAVSRTMLDAQKPGWHALAGTVDIRHYMFDPRDPKTFYVYPPALNTAQLEVMYSAMPTDISEPADGALYSAVVGNISLPDIYASALLDYMLYRAYSKDADFAGNGQRAQSHYAAFTAALAAEIQATLAVQPQVSATSGRTA
jgi:hypothetical protein